MFQASNKLRAKFYNEDDVLKQLGVCEHLRKGNHFTEDHGLIQPRIGYVPTSEDYEAIQYLIDEWDCAYDPVPKEGL